MGQQLEYGRKVKYIQKKKISFSLPEAIMYQTGNGNKALVFP
jgi:hypothetical protein